MIRAVVALCSLCHLFAISDWLSSADKNASIIHIVKYKDPLSLPVAAWPVAYKLEINIGAQTLPPINLEIICNILEALFKPHHSACMNPQNSSPIARLFCLRQHLQK
jgi:hypothetical protein